MIFGNWLGTTTLVVICPRKYTSTNEQDSANLFSNYFSLVYSTIHVDLDAITLDTSIFDWPNNAAFSVEDVF